MKQSRPVNLNLMTVRFPVTAISSICHRVSGVIIFFGIPLALFALGHSLESKEAFEAAKTCFSSPISLVAIWLFLASFTYHVLAGLRHMLMDLGFGESLSSGRAGAYLVLVLGALFALLEGWWLLW